MENCIVSKDIIKDGGKLMNKNVKKLLDKLEAEGKLKSMARL